MFRRPYLVSFVLILALFLGATGCALNKTTTTPQYNAAAAVDDFAIALKGAQDVEIGLNNTGLVPADAHRQIQTIFLTSAQLGQQAQQAVAAGDFQSATAYFQSAIAGLQGLTPQMVFIKNAQSQQTFETSVNVVIAIAQQWVAALQPAAPASTATPAKGK